MARLLLVDDDPVVRRLTRVWLARLGHEVDESAGGQALLRQLGLAPGSEPPDRDRRPELILLDISLPELDGWSILRLLRAHPRWVAVPVVAYSAGIVEGQVPAGFDASVVKTGSFEVFSRNFADAMRLALLKISGSAPKI